jgi:hypothetical protein
MSGGLLLPNQSIKEQLLTHSHICQRYYSTGLDSCSFFITNLTSWRSALLEKLPIVQLLKNFPAFYGMHIGYWWENEKRLL